MQYGDENYEESIENTKVVVKGFLGMEEAYSLKDAKKYQEIGKYCFIVGVLMIVTSAWISILLLLCLFLIPISIGVYFEGRRIESVIRAKLKTKTH